MKKSISTVLLFLAAIIWGVAFSAQKAVESVPPFTLGAARSLLASIFLIFVILIFDKANGQGRRLFSKEKKVDLNRHELIGGILCGVALALASFFQQAGINGGTSAGKASFITALYVIIVPVYALCLKKRAPINVWVSIAIALFGFYLLCITGDFKIVASDLLVIVAALIFPVQILAIDKFSPMCDGVRMSLVQFATATAVNLVLALILESPIAFSAVWSAVLPIIFLGIGSSGIAYTLQIIGQKGVNPAVASLILSLESVFGVVGSAILLKEKMTLREYAGSAIVFVAVILSQLDFKALFAKRNKKN